MKRERDETEGESEEPRMKDEGRKEKHSERVKGEVKVKVKTKTISRKLDLQKHFEKSIDILTTTFSKHYSFYKVLFTLHPSPSIPHRHSHYSVSHRQRSKIALFRREGHRYIFFIKASKNSRVFFTERPSGSRQDGSRGI